MEIESENRGKSLVVCPSGLLAGADAESLRTHLGELAGNGTTEVILDCSKLRFVDSRGLEVLMEAAEQFIRSGQTLKLAGAKPTLREVLDLTELASLFEFQAELPQAQPLEIRG